MTDRPDLPPAHRSGLTPEQYHYLAGFDGDWRDSWWHLDYLQLLGQRLGFAKITRVLDVGCGAGHWGQILLRVLPSTSTLIGVDAEASFAGAALARAEARGFADRVEYRVGCGEDLPFEDDSFDLVTCQTLLMHVPDASQVVSEMARIVRPGGLVLAAEPNNLANTAAEMAATPRPSLDEMLALLELEERCARGKEASGEGNRSIGEILPGVFHDVGLIQVQVHQNDRCSTKIPPYDTDTARVDIEQMLEWIDSGAVSGAGGTYDNGLRWFLADGGTEARYAELWDLAVRRQQRYKEAILAREHVTAGGHVHYLVSGHKPSE